MDGKERVRAALERSEPDHVPLFECALSSKIASEILGREVYIPSNGGSSFRHFLRLSEEGANKLSIGAKESGRAAIELCEQVGLDMIRVRATDFLTPVDFGFGNYGSNWLFDRQVVEIGENRWRLEGPEDFWSVHEYEPFSDSMTCTDHAIVHGGIDEFRRFVEYLERQPITIPEFVFPGLDGVRAAVKAAKQAGIFVVGWGDVAYPGSSPYLPMFLKCMVKQPQLIHRYMEVTTEGAIELIKAQIELGVDGIFGGNDWCFRSGPMFSPAHFQAFFIPHLKRIADTCHGAGLPYIKHLDGNTELLLPYLVEDIRIDALHGIEPSAGMEITELGDSYKDRIALIGTLDCGELLLHGSLEEIIKEVKRVISAVSPGGGHIFSSSNGIHSAVPVDSFLAMVTAVKRFGIYPIEMQPNLM